MKSNEQIRMLKEAAGRIKKVRLKFGSKMTQARFAKLVGVKAPTVTGWEKASPRHSPGPGAFLKLFSVSLRVRDHENALWFFRQTRTDMGDVLTLVTPILEAQGQMPRQSETVRVPETGRLPQGGYGLLDAAHEGILLSTRFVSPASRPQAYVLDSGFAGHIFSVGDRILIDWSLHFDQNPAVHWDQPVLVEFEPLLSEGRVSDYSLHFGVLRKEPGPGGRTQAVLLRAFENPLIVGIAEAGQEISLLSGIRIVGRAFGWLRAPQTVERTEPNDESNVGSSKSRVKKK